MFKNKKIQFTAFAALLIVGVATELLPAKAQIGSHGHRGEQQQQQQAAAACTSHLDHALSRAMHVLDKCSVDYDKDLFANVHNKAASIAVLAYPIYKLRVRHAFSKLQSAYLEDYLQTPGLSQECTQDMQSTLESIRSLLNSRASCFYTRLGEDAELIAILPVLIPEMWYDDLRE